MDIRVEVIFLLVVVLLSSCGQKKEVTNKIYQNQSSTDIREFKSTFLMKCLQKGSNSSCMDSIILNDVSLMGDFPLGINAYQEIDRLATDIRQEIVLDSISLLNRRDYERHKKRTFLFCLQMYNSSKLDSIATKYSIE